VRRAPLFAALLLLFCCADRGIDDAERRAIGELLDRYVVDMAAAYESGDASKVADAATEREQRRIEQAISELASEGRGLRPSLVRLAIDSIERGSRTTVMVDTIETWDLRVVALGSDEVVSESLGQENRLSYVLIREDDEWRILSRQLKSSTQPS